MKQAASGAAAWDRWGPYLSDRAWGTVREDYSPGGTAWQYLPHDHARSRAYRWNEDGLLGISDRHQHVCFAWAVWNGRDPILKERLFGLDNSEGNHGEDVKECYFYLDNVPTHSYMKGLYKYPQAAFPYAELVEENRRRGRAEREYELLDTGVFADDRYWDLLVEYAKAAPDDVLIQLTVTNRGPDEAVLDVLPTVWFRNRWSWTAGAPRPRLAADPAASRPRVVIEDPEMAPCRLECEAGAELLFTENETNFARLWGVANRSPWVKDAFHELLVHGRAAAVNPEKRGTKAAAHYRVRVPAGSSARVRLRLTGDATTAGGDPLGAGFDTMLATRRTEADEFYAAVIPPALSADAASVMRQALGGLLWSKQYFHYDVRRWLEGDPAFPPPPPSRWEGRNRDWTHHFAADVITMPDKWEYPWYAAWDQAFHCLVLAMVDPASAKEQLLLLLREWYMHPNGQIPAYEWQFGDVNPPLHAWAALRVYQIERLRTGTGDLPFLHRVFHKLLLNFTWWVNRKDALGNNIFQGGFLGLDNIGVFDRSAPLPAGVMLGQSDGTSWMAVYCANLFRIAIELAQDDATYEDLVLKFYEHFLAIAHAMSHRGRDGMSLWDEEDGFFYDVVRLPSGEQRPIKVRSLVGLIPLLATEVGDMAKLDRMPDLKQRIQWVRDNRSDLADNVAPFAERGQQRRVLASVVRPEQLRRILKIMLDEKEFLSPYGIRSVSKVHEKPYRVQVAGVEYSLEYEPGESTKGLFGGNSNWRGPIWMPLNYLLIEALQRFDYYLGPEFTVECPTGSGTMKTLWEVAVDLSHRLTRIFVRDADGQRAVNGGQPLLEHDPHWRDLVLFHEYFHGENGRGLGASHQTGWSALVAKLLQQSGASLPTEAVPVALEAAIRAAAGRPADPAASENAARPRATSRKRIAPGGPATSRTPPAPGRTATPRSADTSPAPAVPPAPAAPPASARRPRTAR